MTYDFSKGYVRVCTNETKNRMNDPNRGKGRIKIRYDICLRDGDLTPVHENLTKK